VPDPWPNLIIILLSLLAYALLTACFTALDSVSAGGLRRQSEEGDPRAAKALKYLSHPAAFLRGVALWQLLCLMAALFAAAGLMRPFDPAQSLLTPAAWRALEYLSVGAPALLAFFTLGWLIPRRAALQDPLAALDALCPLLFPFVTLVRPVTGALAWVVKHLLRLFHIDPDVEREEVSEEGIRMMMDLGEERGAIETSEKEMIENVFDFDDTTAGDVMIHRTDMVMLSLEDSDEEILHTIEQTGLSRFPMYDEDPDDVVGILSTRDYLLNTRRPDPRPVRELLREAYFVPELVKADRLFRDLQARKVHLAIVVDEYGGTAGMVTLEDLLEEIVGNIYDEFDPQDEQEIVSLGDNRWRVAGSAELEDISDALGVELPEDEEFDTLGGLVFAQLDVIPEDGSHPEVEICGLHIRVDELSDRRVEWATVTRLSPAAAEPPEE